MGGNKRVCVCMGPCERGACACASCFYAVKLCYDISHKRARAAVTSVVTQAATNNCRIVYRTKHFRWSIRTVVVVILGALARRKDVVHRTDALGEAPVHRHHLELGRSDLGDVALDVALVRVTGPHQLRVHQHFACTPPGQFLVVVNFGTIQKRFQEQQTNAHADRRHMAKQTKQSMKFVRVCDLIELLLLVDKLQ